MTSHYNLRKRSRVEVEASPVAETSSEASAMKMFDDSSEDYMTMQKEYEETKQQLAKEGIKIKRVCDGSMTSNPDGSVVEVSREYDPSTDKVIKKTITITYS